MSAPADLIGIAPGEHVVHFYDDDADLAAAVGPYLVAGARAGEAAIVIASDSHRRAFDAELEAAGVEPAAERASGRLVTLDAAGALAAFRAGGEIDPHAFHEVIGGVVREAARSGRPVRAYGEMVALLWEAGDVAGAIELETLWNELAREVPFALFCAYPAASVSGPEQADSVRAVCELHTAVVAPRLDITADYPADRRAPGRARHDVVAALRRAGRDGELLRDAALVVTELAANAVRHAASPFSLAVHLDGPVLRIAVSDGGGLGDDALTARPLHGLGLIDALATSWGAEPTNSGKVVWAELSA